jgi:hypothetical protein
VRGETGQVGFGDNVVGQVVAFAEGTAGGRVVLRRDGPGRRVQSARAGERFVGEVVRLGKYEEKCRACGDCVLEYTEGICPVTRCSKGLLNGPCGGYSKDGKCEVDPERDCAWVLIYKRLKERGHLDKMRRILDANDRSELHRPRRHAWPRPTKAKK